MAFLSKVVTISELEQFDAAIADLKGTSTANTGLIKQSIEDLKEVNKKIDDEMKAIDDMVAQLTAKRKDIIEVHNENQRLIEKMEAAFIEEKE